MDYVYAVVEPLRTAPTQAGIDGSSLRVVRTRRLAAVVSDHSETGLQISEPALWAHEGVVEALMSDGPVLPMRFGSALRDDAAVQAMLVERRKELTAALEHVRGAVELGVRAAWDADAASGGPTETAVDRPGAAYLLGRSQSRRRARLLAERVDRAVGGLCRTRVQRLLSSPSLPVSAAYLVDHGRVEAFRTAIDSLDAQVDEAQIVCTGPWPPYSFSEAQDA